MMKLMTPYTTPRALRSQQARTKTLFWWGTAEFYCVPLLFCSGISSQLINSQPIALTILWFLNEEASPVDLDAPGGEAEGKAMQWI